jgi:RimJ/RimL family protein N-acetyltransferase
MFQIQTERLSLVALSYEQLLLLNESRTSLEKQLGLTISDFEVNSPYDFIGGLQEAINNFMLHNVRQHPENFQWYTHWLIIERSTQLTVGGIGASGLPDPKGEVMIGYFIDAKSEGKGYATEAVKGLTAWMQGHPELRAIIADTLIDGFASQRVLQKAGFEVQGSSEDGLRWEWKRK